MNNRAFMNARKPGITPGRWGGVWWCFAWLIAFLSCSAVVAAPAAQADQASDEASPATVVLLDVNGAIGPAATEYLTRELSKAAEQNAEAVILRLDTPGGLVSSMRDINRAILASPVPVITYVGPSGAQAASAGTYILYASHLAAMAPGTNLGAATPVQMGGSPGAPPSGAPEKNDDDADKEPASSPHDAMTAKAVNDSVAYIRSLASIHGRNADWAESAVREAASLPADAALEQNVIEIIAHDLPNLLEQAHGRSVKVGGATVTLNTENAVIVEVAPDWRVNFLGAITNPNLAYILLLIGIYGIIFELMNPGAIFPGALGAISLVTALLALNMLPINYAGMGLLLLGIGLMAAEAFVPSFGALGIGGLVAFGLGSVLLFDGDIPGLTISMPLIIATALASLLLLAVVLSAVVRAHRRQVVSGNATLLGQTARVQAWAGDVGTVLIHGESWQAQSTGDELLPGETVRVLARNGLTLTVEPASSELPSSPQET